MKDLCIITVCPSCNRETEVSMGYHCGFDAVIDCVVKTLCEKCGHEFVYDSNITKPLEEFERIIKTEVTVEVPKEIMDDLFIILCGVPFSSYEEVSSEIIPRLKKAHDFVIKYGHDNNINSHGE